MYIMQEIKVLSVNVSDKKGIIKTPVDTIHITNIGIEGDAHSGNWHRQISLLGKESIDKYSKQYNKQIRFGEFAENITTEGIELFRMKPFDRIESEKIILEVTQIGKKCHGEKCNIFKETGDCVMPKEGIFCRVIKGGSIQAGDVLYYVKKVIKIKIITLSDRASRGEYIDSSGPLARGLVEKYFAESGRDSSIELNILPDEAALLQNEILQSVKNDYDIIITTGGTGIGIRDISPDVIRPMLSKEITGIMEYIRTKYGSIHPNALISRSLAGTINQSLIYVLPGHPKAVNEYLDEILKTIEHSLNMLHNIDSH